MEFQPECFVSGPLETVLRLSKFAGIAPLRFKKKGNSMSMRLSTNLFELISPFIVIVNNILLFGVSITQTVSTLPNLEHMSYNNIVQLVVHHSKVLMMIMLVFKMVFGRRGQMRCVIGCLNSLQKINSELNIRHWPTQRSRKLIGIFIIWGIFTIVLSIVDLVLTTIIFMDGSSVWKKLSLCLTHVDYCLIQLRLMQYVLFLLHVRSGITTVNDSLRNLLRDIKHRKLRTTTITAYKKVDINVESMGCTWKQKIKIDTIAQLHENIRRIARAYAATCDVVRKVDRSQGLLVLMFLGISFVDLITTSYYVIRHVRTHEISGFSALYVSLSLSWCITYAFNLMMLIEPCHLTHMEMDTTRELVSRLMQCTQSGLDSLAVELEQFYRQLILNNVTYKAYKGTTMTRSLFLTILGNVTTYLVIIIKI